MQPLTGPSPIAKQKAQIFDSLVLYNDEYFLLQDYPSFYEAQMAADKLYQEPKDWPTP